MLRRSWGKYVAFLYRIGADYNDTKEQSNRKVILVGASFLGTVFGLIFIAVFFNLYPLAKAVTIFGAAIIAINLLVFSSTRSFQIFRFVLLLSILFVPFLQSLAMGGFVVSSAIALWSFISVLLALMTKDLQKTGHWFYAFLALVVIAGTLEPYVSPYEITADQSITYGFVFNISIVTMIVFILLRYIVDQKNTAYGQLAQEKEKADNLLLNILPKKIAATLKEEEGVIADHYEEASILFVDIVGFTPLSKKLSPVEMVQMLNAIYSYFDSLVRKYGLEKIRTIGDTYMVASGVPVHRADHAQALAKLALEMLNNPQQIPAKPGAKIQFRLGINSGPLVAGVIGQDKFHYDVWGPTVNFASRMESQGVAGKIQVSKDTYHRLQDEFVFEERGPIDVRGTGKIETWFLVGRKDYS